MIQYNQLPLNTRQFLLEQPNGNKSLLLKEFFLDFIGVLNCFYLKIDKKLHD